jgi:hypothetical protein
MSSDGDQRRRVASAGDIWPDTPQAVTNIK